MRRLKIIWMLFLVTAYANVSALTNDPEEDDGSIEDTRQPFYDTKQESDLIFEAKKNDLPTVSEDTIFLPHETYCQYFYAFDGRDSYVFICASGHRFDAEKLQCLKTKDVNCGKRKKNVGSSEEKYIGNNFKCPKWSGFYPHKHYCHLFYNCESKKASLYMCPPGKMFDTRTSKCLIQNNVNCEKRENPYTNNELEDFGMPDPNSDSTYYCQNSINGVYPDYLFCYKFIRCWYGLGEVYICPKGKSFDEELKKCRPRDSVHCHNRFNPDVLVPAFTFCRGGW